MEDQLASAVLHMKISPCRSYLFLGVPSKNRVVNFSIGQSYSLKNNFQTISPIQKRKLKQKSSSHFSKSTGYPYQNKSSHHNAPLHAQYLLFIF